MSTRPARTRVDRAVGGLHPPGGARGVVRRSRRSSVGGRTIASALDLGGHGGGRLVREPGARRPQQPGRRRQPGTPVCAVRSSASWTRSGLVGVRGRGDVGVGPGQRDDVVVAELVGEVGRPGLRPGVPARRGGEQGRVDGDADLRARPRRAAASSRSRPPGRVSSSSPATVAALGPVPPSAGADGGPTTGTSTETGVLGDVVGRGASSRNVRWMPTRAGRRAPRPRARAAPTCRRPRAGRRRPRGRPARPGRSRRAGAVRRPARWRPASCGSAP